MKPNIILLLLFNFLISDIAYSQTNLKSPYPKFDFYNLKQSLIDRKNSDKENYIQKKKSDTLSDRDKLSTNNDQQSTIYMDTRLGSSSKLYDTYEKNDYGAGAITTNPNK